MLPHPFAFTPIAFFIIFIFNSVVLSELLLQAQQLRNRETIVSPFACFSSHSAQMTLSDGSTATLRVGDVVDLTDDHPYRVLKIFAPSVPIVFKRTDGSTHRSFLRTLDHVVIRAPPMVNRSTQTDLPNSATHDPLADSILQCCGPTAVAAYYQGRPYCLGDVHWVTLPETITSGLI